LDNCFKEREEEIEELEIKEKEIKNQNEE